MPSLYKPTRYNAWMALGVATFCPLLLAATVQAQTLTIELIGPKGDVLDPENNSQYACNVSVEYQAGRTVTTNLNSPGGDCYELRPQIISFKSFPSAVKILGNDSPLCDTGLGDSFKKRRDPSTNENFWFELQTTRNSAQLAEIGIDRLFNNVGKLLTNTSETGTQTSIGVKVNKAQRTQVDAVVNNLSCISIIMPSGPASSLMGNTIAVDHPESWINSGPANKEDFTCPDNTVIVGRHQTGDETADTKYKCGPVEGLLRVDSALGTAFPECGYRVLKDTENDWKNCTDAVNYKKSDQDYHYFRCPVDQVMVGRKHQGDENAETQYKCATLYKGSEAKKNTVFVEVDANWSTPAMEQGLQFVCDANKVMVGRAHRSDEQGDTRYLCASLRSPAESR